MEGRGGKHGRRVFTTPLPIDIDVEQHLQIADRKLLACKSHHADASEKYLEKKAGIYFSQSQRISTERCRQPVLNLAALATGPPR